MKKLLSIILLLVFMIVLSGCGAKTPYQEPGLSEKEVEALINVAILEDRLNTQDRLDYLQSEISSLKTEISLMEIKDATYNYDYTVYYLNDWTDEQLYAAVKQVFDDDHFTDEMWEELIMEIIEDYDLIDATEDQLLEFMIEAFMIALEEQAADGITE